MDSQARKENEAKKEALAGEEKREKRDFRANKAQ